MKTPIISISSQHPRSTTGRAMPLHRRRRHPLLRLFPLLLLLLLLIVLVPAAKAAVDNQNDDDGDDGECSATLPLDTPRPAWTRPITTAAPLAQARFDQGMALSFAFNHDEAARSLAAALTADPACVSCALGLAMALAPNINRPEISAEALERAQQAVQLAEQSPALPVATAVERAWVTAAGRRFPPERNASAAGMEYDEAYRDALRQMALDFPDDPDLPALFAEAAMTTMPWAYYCQATQAPKPLTQEVLAALGQTLAIEAGHPLALHLLIHALEPSAHPGLALPAAERLAALPAGDGFGHLVHMPGHVYVRVGLYHAASEANQRAISLDRRYFASCHISIAPEEEEQGNYNAYYRMLYFSHKHAFLLYSAGMEGRRGLAIQAADELEGECALATVARVLGGSFLAYTAWPWLVRLRFGAWAAVLEETEAVDPAELLPYTAAMRHYARAFALASFSGSGRCPAAALVEASAFARLAANATTRAEPLFLITAGQAFDVAEASLRARLAEAGCGADGDDGGRSREGLLRLGGSMRGGIAQEGAAVGAWARAVALVDAFPYMEPPMWPNNLRACLGQALLDEGRFVEAQAVFEADLGEWRDNGWSLKGLQLALEGQGKWEEARLVRRAFEAAWRYADVDLERSCF